MEPIVVQRAYGMRPRTVFALVASGEFFVACGAKRSSIEVDFRPGGRVTTSVIAGTYSALTDDSIALALDDGTRVELSVGGEKAGSLTVVHHGADADRRAWWEAGLAAFAPPPGRFDADADERQSYEDWLDFYRTVIPGKLRGVSEEDARRKFVESATTLLGLVKHLTGVERKWFGVVIAQRPPAEVGPNSSGGDDSWIFDPGDTIASVLAEYEEVCGRSRRIAVRHELADTMPNGKYGDISVRMIYVHMIEEIARHAGHADILREMLDGTTGVDPLAG